MLYRIGHPAYSGANRAHPHAVGYRAALSVLLARGVPMQGAHRALAAARDGSHAVCSRVWRGVAVESIEVVAAR